MITAIHGVIASSKSNAAPSLYTFEASVVPLDYVTSNTVTATGADYEVDWGSGFVPVLDGASASAVASGPITVRSLSAVTNIVFDTDTFTGINITQSSSLTSADSMCLNLTNLTTFDIADTSGVTSFDKAWKGCSSITAFPQIDVSSAGGSPFVLAETWSGCSSLLAFPGFLSTIPANAPFGIILISTWQDCSSMTSFASIGTSNVVNCGGTWFNCSSLTSFPELDWSACTDFSSAWKATGLTSFPAFNATSVTGSFEAVFQDCADLVCLNNIDASSASTTTNMFTGCTSLSAPDGTEQSAILAGGNYTNGSPCP